MISPSFYIIFSKFWFLGVASGVKGQKMVQNDERFWHALYLRKHTSYDFHLCTHVQNGNISRCFFHFIKIVIFHVVMGVKRQKTVQSEEKLSVTLHIAETIHYMIFIYVFLVQMIISPGIFFFVSFYQNFDFPGLLFFSEGGVIKGKL